MPPAIKCNNGKWRWGETGRCKYSTKKQAEDDNVSYNKIEKINNMEKRIYNVETRIDSNQEGKEMVVGHASVYNSRSEFMGFYEYIAPGAFTQELIDNSDVRALINHDANFIFAEKQILIKKIQL